MFEYLQKIALRRNAAVLIAVLALLLSAAVEDPEGQLKALRERISKVQAEIEAETARRDKETTQLARVERQAALATGKLEQTRTSLDHARRDEQRLRAEVATQRDRLVTHQGALAAQARAAYAGGQTERVRLLLSQQDPGRFGRILVYYRYLSEMRSDQIEAVSTDLARLAQTQTELSETSRRLSELETRQRLEVESLEASRAERGRIVARLDAALRDRRTEAEKLAAEAASLEVLIEELQQLLVDLPGADREPFATMKGKLDWPAPGVLLSDYGQPRAGGSLKWNGVLVGASRGTEVRAVYHGRVAYADWLPGMGLLLVIEHGDGYMSLYGHNEALYKQLGEWVQPGDVIASAGDSGGRSQSALYFEIRNGTRPEDPHRWFRTRLPTR
ncbi:MAG: peptidoglycan DD-metalloendopeptidase family protein [Chromatiales bacterium]|jgi:septal ring factor EnvC (AmiA/AmiB activator)|nr:peptidoglycan DD-metalloendopeptidase family protein [Chromatiales bacterium]MDH4031552.1 peptidoglycan DD-metalloendopeptidase family protein [Chromatiales bacterium]